MVPKRGLAFVLPYLDKLSLDLGLRLSQTMERDLPYCKLKIIFRSKCRLEGMLQSIFCINMNTHSGRKCKIYLKNYFFKMF